MDVTLAVACTGYCCSSRTPALVSSGLDAVEKIEAVALNGEEPQQRVELLKVTIVKKWGWVAAILTLHLQPCVT